MNKNKAFDQCGRFGEDVVWSFVGQGSYLKGDVRAVVDIRGGNSHF